MAESDLVQGKIRALPLIHGRLPFAMEARRLLLSKRYPLIAVELPPSLKAGVELGLDVLPEIAVVLYREQPAFLDHEQKGLFYVPIDPCDGIIEALRIARGERTPVVFVDAEVEAYEPEQLALPDPSALLGLGLELWYRTVLPLVRAHPGTEQDRMREAHMAARLKALQAAQKEDRQILFLCGLAHWEPIKKLLAHPEGGQLHKATGPPSELVTVETIHPRSLPHLLGEMPRLTYLYEQHRNSLALAPFDLARALKQLLMEGRAAHEQAFPDSLEKASTERLRTLLIYLRKLVVSKRRLFPDSFTLAVAAKGTVGNDYTVELLKLVNSYPPNKDRRDGLRMTAHRVRLVDKSEPARPRTPGELSSLRSLRLKRRPKRRYQERWRQGWNPLQECSWPPEDVLIENFREHLSRRALSMAGLENCRTEPFQTSFKDGIAIRETIRDWHLGKIHVKEEPPAAGQVGALVTIFEEDDDGTRFPWRTTWMAEHEGESSLAFYATDPRADMAGPGIGRFFYGGCLFLYPPLSIPNVWNDLRFEQARRPSERLLLAALHYSRERFVAHLGPTPPAPEVRAQAAALGRHIIYLPLSQFSSHTLEKLRRAHVLNGQEVRSWAARFIP